MIPSTKDRHRCTIGGQGYWFRTPTVYDLPALRRTLTRRRVRRPSQKEFEVAALAGIAALAETVGDPAEGARQREIMEDWFPLLEPVREDDIDEPDFALRAKELAEREGARVKAQEALLPQVVAIQATLERHWPPYAELLADRRFYDEVSNIEVVRLLLVGIGEGEVRRDADGLLPEAVYQAVPRAHLAELTAFALRLLVPTETERKN
jgi:hypothetical protein